jgi:RNA polymerase sigma-70 factor (ECF subfamily)|tara:strand:- start:1736 stop:2323 length:588 start_codon:yes stop_codon:yes gene_type:complete
LKNQCKKNILSDEAIIGSYLATLDASLFKIIYDRYYFFILNKCHSFSKNNQESEDLCQDIFMKLLQKISTFNGNSKFSTWLYALTFNHCVNHYNRNKYNNFRSNSYNIDLFIDKDTFCSNEDEIIWSSKLEKLKIAMKQISIIEKDILIQKYYNFKSIKELGVIYNLRESAVKMRIKRAKDKLASVYNSNLRETS